MLNIPELVASNRFVEYHFRISFEVELNIRSDYIAKAVRFSSDKKYFQQIKHKVISRRHLIYEVNDAIFSKLYVITTIGHDRAV